MKVREYQFVRKVGLVGLLDGIESLQAVNAKVYLVLDVIAKVFEKNFESHEAELLVVDNQDAVGAEEVQLY